MRYLALVIAAVATIILLVFSSFFGAWAAWLAPLTGALTALGVWDLVQTKHSLRRNYPILANLRFLLEEVRPEIRQYFLESDLDGTPFNRSKRSVVYQRAKSQLDKRPFGTQQDVYAENYEWLTHSLSPAKVSSPNDMRVKVGGPACKQP